uniref:RNA polymerase sigma-70 domain-containing protein n=2 Tax=Spumella elongata TaxID=89044 RepID=A0A7S3HHZ5_9STRA|mmetsp:Transcript_5212/g.8822  ORF Transcript_5212/g.8822 Transcript_5212/m.8822 type:complete len:437 (+) Transcript_5212:60-1370(+)
MLLPWAWGSFIFCSFFLSQAVAFRLPLRVVPLPRVLKTFSPDRSPHQPLSKGPCLRLHAQPAGDRSDAFNPGNVLTKSQYNAKPLSLKEDIRLGIQMKLGKVIEKESKKYSAEHGTAPTLAFLAGRFNTTEETIETSLQNMQMAKEMLITSNQKLALHIAKFYMYRGVPFGTLMQEASNGLVKALEKYDPEKGFKFSTYASWWVKMACTRCIAEKSRVVRVPIHVHDLLLTLERVYEELSNKYCRNPTNEEIAERMAVPVKKVDFLMTQRVTVINLESNVYQERLNDTPGKEVRFKDIIPTLEPDPLSTATVASQRDIVLGALSGLSEREREIIIMRHGLSGTKKMTLDEIGSKFKITKERVRQIENRILAKLRLQLNNDKTVQSAFSNELWNEQFANQEVPTTKTKRVKPKPNDLSFNGIQLDIPMGDIESLLAE